MAAKPGEGRLYAAELSDLSNLLARQKHWTRFGFGWRHRGDLILQECSGCRIHGKKQNAPENPEALAKGLVSYGAAGPDPARIRCTTNKRIASPSRM